MSDPIAEFPEVKPVVGRVPALALLIAILAVPLHALAPRIEAALFPVVTDHDVAYRVEGDRLFMSTTGRKDRDCTAERRESTAQPRGGDPIRLHWRMGPRRVTEPGAFDLDNVTVLPGPLDRPTRIDARMLYRCHPLWLTPHVYPTGTVEPAAVAPAPGV